MKHSAINAVAALAVLAVLGGCDDIFGYDNYEAPTSVLRGQLLYQGEPVGLRSRAVELELWQPGPEFVLNTKIPVKLAQDGSFRSVIFDGSYELNLIAGAPWVHDAKRIPVEVKGEAVVDIPVVPYYLVRNAQVVNNGGRIDATFSVGQITTTRALEYVGLYVGTTDFVDRINQVARLERTPAQIGNLNVPVTMSVQLPANIKVTQGPEQRTRVNVRLGVKVVGIAEMLFTKSYEVAI